MDATSLIAQSSVAIPPGRLRVHKHERPRKNVSRFHAAAREGLAGTALDFPVATGHGPPAAAVKLPVNPTPAQGVPL